MIIILIFLLSPCFLQEVMPAPLLFSAHLAVTTPKEKTNIRNLKEVSGSIQNFFKLLNRSRRRQRSASISKETIDLWRLQQQESQRLRPSNNVPELKFDKLEAVMDFGFSIADLGVFLLRPDPVSIGIVVGLTAIGVGVYYGYHWYQRRQVLRQVPTGYANKEMLSLQIGTGKPLYGLSKEKTLFPLLPDSLKHDRSFNNFIFWAVILSILVLNSFLLLVFFLQNPSSRSKVRSSLFRKKQKKKKSSKQTKKATSNLKTVLNQTRKSSSSSKKRMSRV